MGSRVFKKEKPIGKTGTMYGNCLLAVTCALITLPLFFRGLFFEREFRVFLAATSLVFIAWFLFDRYNWRQVKLFRYKYEYFLFGIVLLYFLVVPFSVNQRAALLEAMKYGGYAVIYILVREQACKDDRAAKVLLYTLIAGVFIVSSVGILNYIGIMDSHGALAGRRIASTLQYPNSLAAVTAGALCLSLAVSVNAGKLLKSINAAVQNILVITFILTLSRTMWIILPVVLLVLISLMPSTKRVSLIAIMLSGFIPAAGAAGILAVYSGGSTVMPVVAVLVSMMLSVLMVNFSARFTGLVLPDKILKSAVAVVVLLAAGIGCLAVFVTQPLELEHYGREDGRLTSNKKVYSIEGEGDFILRLDMSADQKDTKPWLGRVLLSSVAKDYSTDILKDYYINEPTDGIIEIPFKTRPDTYYVQIGFSNHYQDTGFIIRKAEIIEQSTGETRVRVKLDYKFLPRALASRIESINYKESSVQARLAFFRDAFGIIKKNFIIGIGGAGWESSYMAYRSYDYWTTQTHSYPIQVWLETGTIGITLMLGFVGLYGFKLYKSYKGIESTEKKLVFSGIVLFGLTIFGHSFVDFDLALGSISIMLWASVALAAAYMNPDTDSIKREGLLKKAVVLAVVLLLTINLCWIAASEYNVRASIAAEKDDLDEAERLLKLAVRLNPLESLYRKNLARVIHGNAKYNSKERYEKSVAMLEKAIGYDRYNYELYGELAQLYFAHREFGRAVESIDKTIFCNPAVPDPYIHKMRLLYEAGRMFHEDGQYDVAGRFLQEIKAIEDIIKDNNSRMQRPIKIKPEFFTHIYKANFILRNLNNKNAFELAENVVVYEDFDFDSDGDLLPDLWVLPYKEGLVVKSDIVREDDAEVFGISSDNNSFYTERAIQGLEPSCKYFVVVQAKSGSGAGKMAVEIRDANDNDRYFSKGGIALSSDYTVYEGSFETSDDLASSNQIIRLSFEDEGKEVRILGVALLKVN